MRWLKHLSTAQSDEKMALILAEHGPWGYGCFWLVLETIAQVVDEEDRTFICLPEPIWRKKLGISSKKLTEIFSFFQKIGIFRVVFEKNGEKKSEILITVDSPNLLKYRDEYSRKKTRNSGVTPESLRSKETDTDTESDREEDKSSSPVGDKPKRGSRIDPDWMPSEADVEFAMSLGFSREQIPDIADGFRDYWLAKAGPQGVKRDWPATWRNWGRKDIEMHGDPRKRGVKEQGYAAKSTRFEGQQRATPHDQKLGAMLAGAGLAARGGRA